MVTATRRAPRPLRNTRTAKPSRKTSSRLEPFLGRRCLHPPPQNIWGTDTETTGASLHHGCLPFYVSSCSSAGELLSWEWDVDPETRTPIIPEDELEEVLLHVSQEDHVWHNARFDIRALVRAAQHVFRWKEKKARTWGREQLDRAQDTHVMGHVLASSESHKLKDRALVVLGIEDDDERDLQDAVNVARRYGRKMGWRIANIGDPHFPMIRRRPTKGWWPMDMWLPRAVAQARWKDGEEEFNPDLPEDQLHPFWTVLGRYALTDAERTMGLWEAYREEADEDPAVWDLYEPRRRHLGIAWEMEENGTTLRKPKLTEAAGDYGEEAERTRKVSLRMADHCLDNLNSPKQLQGALYGHLGLKPKKRTKEGWSTDADTLRELILQVSTKSKPYHFIRSLMSHRKLSKAVDYLDAYRLSGFPVKGMGKDWLRIHPSYNICGTATTRLASYDPNTQNISKQEDFNLRRVFGPLPGREWWSIDYKNIELRIFAYQSGDQRLIDAFERGQSVHLIIGEVLHPKLFSKLGPEKFKKREEYRWTKNGNFSLIYGASQKKADATYRVPGAYDRIRKTLPKIDRFIQSKYQEGRETGRVITLGGYPLQVPAREPHKAANYFVQGSAGWAMVMAMVRVDAYLRSLEEDVRLIMSIHDELNMDSPQGTSHAIIQDIVDLMEESGTDLGLPTPVDVELITDNWAEGQGVKLAA